MRRNILVRVVPVVSFGFVSTLDSVAANRFADDSESFVLTVAAYNIILSKHDLPNQNMR